MSQIDTTPAKAKQMRNGETRGGAPPGRVPGGGSERRGGSGREGGVFTQYKPEQGKWTRRGTFIGAGALVAWGGYFVYDRLRIYEGDEAWRLLITSGIPVLVMVVFGALAYWASFVHRKSSDFMIATEGEMKKVNWSTKREVIGSTKVVITITFLLAILLFVVDLLFQALFRWLGVLKG